MLLKWLFRASLPSRSFTSATENWRDRYKAITELSNFTTEKFDVLIRNYFLIYSGAKNDSTKIDWEADPQVQLSLTRLVPFINQLKTAQVVVLVRNISLFNIRDHEIWKGIEKSLLENHLEKMTGDELVAVIQNLGYMGRSTSQIWEKIDRVLLEKLDSGAIFSGQRLVSVLLALRKVRKGSEETIEKIIARLETSFEDLLARDINDLILSCIYSDSAPETIVEAVERKAEEMIDIFEAKTIEKLFCFFFKFKPNTRIIEKLEEQALVIISDFTLNNLSDIAFFYAKYRREQINQVGREREFMRTIEKYYARNKEEIKNGIKKKEVNEIRLMWGLSRAKCFEEREMWKEYARTMKSYRGLPRNSADCLLDIAKELKQAGIIED
jgi:hypothetical protein